MQNESDILQSAVDSLIGKQKFSIEIPIIKHPPLPKRTFWDWITRKPKPIQEGVRVFNINPCVVGNMYRIAGRAVRLPEEIKEGTLFASILPVIHEHLEDIVYIVAAGIQNDKNEPEPSLIDFIENNFDAEDLYNSLFPVLENVGMQSFLNSIVLAKGTVKILKPKQTSPSDGSELIASHTQALPQLEDTLKAS